MVGIRTLRKHHDYWEWNEDFRKFVDNLNDSLPTPTPQAVNKIIGAWKLASATVAEWKKDTLPFIDKKLGDIKKSSKPDASDQRVSRDLGKIGVDAKKVVTADTALATFVTQFEGRQAEASTRPMTADEARVIQTTFAADGSAWPRLSSNSRSPPPRRTSTTRMRKTPTSPRRRSRRPSRPS